MLGRQLHITPAYDMIEQVALVENDADGPFRKKPKSTTGLWTSSWREETQDSDWIEWCRGNEYGEPDTSQWFLLTPQEDVRVYVIDSLADLERLLKNYMYVSPMAKRLQGTDSHLLQYFTSIDFERLSQDYDALHLTERGNARLHLNYPIDMNAWDSESTVWFRWCFTKVEKIAPIIAQEV